MKFSAKHVTFAKQTATVALGSTDVVATFKTKGVERIYVQIDVTGFALDAFVISALTGGNTSYNTLYSTALQFTSPGRLIKDASGDLTTQAVGTGWFIMETLGIESVRISASSSNAAGSTVVAWAGGI